MVTSTNHHKIAHQVRGDRLHLPAMFCPQAQHQEHPCFLALPKLAQPVPGGRQKRLDTALSPGL